MDLELVFLGSGTSAGVPMIACHCAVCTSADIRDQRMRPSVLIRFSGETPADSENDARVSNPTETIPETVVDAAQRRIKHILIDTSPEMRLQMVRETINHLDAILYTHAHADHIFGIDDLRRFNAVMMAPIDIYAETHTANTIRSIFRYIFEPENNINKSFIASLNVKTVTAEVPFELHGVKITPIRLLHGNLPIVGYRFDMNGKSIAYCTDVSHVPEESYPLLQGLDVLVIDALRYLPHPTHFTVDQALEVISRCNPRQSYFTHIGHDILHSDLEPRLPAGVKIAYDRLVVTP